MRKPKTSRLPGGWYGLSLALHILAAAALVWFTPLRSVIDEIIERREEAAREYAMSSEQVRKLSEVIGESAENRVRNNVQRLAEIQKRMDELREDRLEEYRKTGLPGDDGDARRALEAMKQALEEARAARDEMDKLDKAKSDTLEERLDAIEEAQEKAAQALPALDERWRDAASAMDEVYSLQNRVRQAWVNARGRDDDDDVKDLEKKLRDLEKRWDSLQEKEENVEKRRERVVDQRKKVREWEEQIAAAETGKERTRAVNKRDKALEKMKKREMEVDKYALKTAAYRAEYERRKAELAGTQEQIDAVKQTASDQWAEAKTLQSEAVGAQERAIAAMGKAIAAPASEKNGPSKDPAFGLEAMDAEKLYETAQKLESRIAGSYKIMRAAEVAALREVPLGKALRQTDAPRPGRPELAVRPPSDEVQTSAELEASKKQLQAVIDETQSMIGLGQTLLNMAEAQARRREEGVSVSLEERRRRADALDNLARVDVSGKAVDLSAAMRQTGAAIGAGQGTKDGRDGHNGKSTLSTEAAGGAGGAASAQPTSSTSPPASASTLLCDGFIPAQEVKVSSVDVLARRIASDGDGARWMAIDSWYIIGPFANPKRENIDRRFPPESVIDLDATYMGKDNRPVRWEWKPAGQLRVVPDNEEEYGIWYATTEFKSDRDRDIWLAMGSDDKGMIWINDQLVWVSGSRHKDWTKGEALRRIHLRPGRNRILYRIENGHGGMAFSLCLSLEDQRTSARR